MFRCYEAKIEECEIVELLYSGHRKDHHCVPGLWKHHSQGLPLCFCYAYSIAWHYAHTQAVEHNMTTYVSRVLLFCWFIRMANQGLLI